jgi:hypothetical protein
METNIIRDYNEMIGNTIVSSQKYSEKILYIKTDDDKDQCLRFLTLTNNHKDLCHNLYDDKYINTVIESSDYLLFFHETTDPRTIVAFALVKLMSKKKGKIINILLVCAIPNKKRFGQMISHSLYNFAVQRECAYLYTSPRTPELRKTFMQYGFEPVYGREGVDEVLEKEVDSPLLIPSRGRTRKVRRD